MYWLLCLSLFFSGILAEEWEASNFPNPTTGKYEECRMLSPSNICDPDEVLSEEVRNRLNDELKHLETTTRQDNERNSCEKKGITAAMTVIRHVKGGSTEAVSRMANDMLRKWSLDLQCHKSILIAFAADDHKFWVARDNRVPVNGTEFTSLFNQQRTLFQQQNYEQALTNFLQGTSELALSKQRTLRKARESGIRIGKPVK